MSEFILKKRTQCNGLCPKDCEDEKKKIADMSLKKLGTTVLVEDNSPQDKICQDEGASCVSASSVDIPSLSDKMVRLWNNTPYMENPTRTELADKINDILREFIKKLKEDFPINCKEHHKFHNGIDKLAGDKLI